MSRFLPIHHTFAPHVHFAYALKSLGLLFVPWKWKNGRSREAFRKALGGSNVFLFSSGRTALYALLKALPLRPGEEIIVPAYTCIVVPNAIHAAGGTVIYCDIEKDTLNFDFDDLKKRISPRTRAILCQHTFGIPANMPALKLLSKERGILLIEDCAHIIPDASGPHEIMKGELAIFSFGRDKAISGVSGGAVLCNNSSIAQRLQELETTATSLSLFTIMQYLHYPILYFKARFYYGIGLGKAALAFAAKIGMLPKILSDEEKQGFQNIEISKIPNACASLALSQVKKLKVINDHRRMLTKFYRSECEKRGWYVLTSITDDLPLQKFPLFFPDAQSIRNTLKAKNIHLNDGWVGCTVCPETVDPSAAAYQPGSAYCSEELAEQILSLPTHPTMTLKQAKELLREMDKVVESIPEPARAQGTGHRDLTITQATNQSEWDNFLTSQPYSPFLQSWTMATVLESLNNKVFRFEIRENNQIVAICLAQLVPARRGKHLSVSYGPVIAAGANREQALELFLNALRETAKENGCSFLRLSPFWDIGTQTIPNSLPSPLHLLGEHLWYLPLKKDMQWDGSGEPRTEDEIQKEMRSTTRNLIRRAAKEGVTIRKSQDPNADIEHFLKLHDETRKRHKFTPYSNAFFRAQVRKFSKTNECTLYLADYQCQIIAASIHMHFGHETSYHHGASSYEHNKIPASYLLQWTAITDALKRGDSVYNFWGIAPEGVPHHPFSGVTLFKTGFGGALKTLEHCRDIPLSWKYYVTRAFEFVRKWRRGF